MTLKTILLFGLCVAATSASAEQPTTVRLKVDLSDLLPGTRYEIAVQGEYGLIDPKSPQETQYSAKSKDIAKLDFVATRNTFSHADFVLRLPSGLPAPPHSHIAGLLFTVDLTITPPDKSGLPRVQRRRIFATPSAGGEVPRCLRLRGPSLSGFFYAGVAECSQPLKERPAGTDRQ